VKQIFIGPLGNDINDCKGLKVQNSERGYIILINLEVPWLTES